MIQNRISSPVLPNLARALALILLWSFCGRSAGAAASDKVIYTFTGGSNGAYPYGTLLADKAGNLYGTTAQGGSCTGDANGCGTVFELSPGTGGWTEKPLYAFEGPTYGENPVGGVVMDKSGNLYGIAGLGQNYCGIVFELTPSSTGAWTETTLYSFQGDNQNDGCGPESTPTLDSKGNIYGTTVQGGDFNSGTAFELSPPSEPGGAWSETLLFSFNDANGSYPYGGVVFDNAGSLYGTTNSGGSFSMGNVFKLTPTSGGWNETSIFSFTGGDNGCFPLGGVVFDEEGNLYGTTTMCGADDVGTVFKLSPTVGQWTMTVLHTFTGAIDGAEPFAGLTLDSEGNIYGSTYFGGFFADGTVFKLAPGKNNKWAESEYGFKGGEDGANPYAVPTLRRTTCFGTTVYGGSAGMGTVYEISFP